MIRSILEDSQNVYVQTKRDRNATCFQTFADEMSAREELRQSWLESIGESWMNCGKIREGQGRTPSRNHSKLKENL